MPVVTGPYTALIAFVAGCLSWQRGPATEVRCVVDSDCVAVSEKLVSILGEQLARCGPSNLTHTPCQPCVGRPCVTRVPWWIAWSVLLAFVGGVFVGFRLSRLLSVTGERVKVAPLENVGLVVTPSSLRALKR